MFWFEVVLGVFVLFRENFVFNMGYKVGIMFVDVF